MRFGSLINHILLGKHHRSFERSSLKDTTMKTYHCKLEEVGNRRIMSVDLSVKEKNICGSNTLTKGWALPIRKSNKGFSIKQRDYLEAKFNEGVSGVKHWKPKDVVTDMENLRIENRFYFLACEILNENQILSFFGRMKRERYTTATKDLSVKHMNVDDVFVQDGHEQSDEENIQSDLDALEDFKDTEAAIDEAREIENVYLRAKNLLETSVP